MPNTVSDIKARDGQAGIASGRAAPVASVWGLDDRKDRRDQTEGNFIVLARNAKYVLQ